MSEVDPDDDDDIWRWVIHHYRFDPMRNQRRNVRVAAYDDESEFRSELDRYTELIRSEITAGTRSSRESVSGTILEPGHVTAQARGHDVRRAIEHGVNPERLLRTGLMPHNMALLGFHDEDFPPAGPRP